jgi:hypothetical protein
MARGVAAIAETKPKPMAVARKPVPVGRDADAAAAARAVKVAAIVDEFGQLEVKLDAMKKLVDRRNELRDVILGWYENSDRDRIIRAEGKMFDVEVSACAIERTITNMPALFRRLGQKMFLELCKFSLAKLDEYIAPVEQSPFVTSAQTGPRRVKAIAKLVSAN